MDDDAGSLLQHSWKEGAIETNRDEQIDVEGALPFVVAKNEGAAAGGGRAADVVDEDIEGAKVL